MAMTSVACFGIALCLLLAGCDQGEAPHGHDGMQAQTKQQIATLKLDGDWEVGDCYRIREEPPADVIVPPWEARDRKSHIDARAKGHFPHLILEKWELINGGKHDTFFWIAYANHEQQDPQWFTKRGEHLWTVSLAVLRIGNEKIDCPHYGMSWLSELHLRVQPHYHQRDARTP